MQIAKIYSTRNSNKEVYSHLIYEWEDDYSKHLKVPIYSFSTIKSRCLIFFFKLAAKLKLDRVIQKIDNLRMPRSYCLVFELYPRSFFAFQVSCDKIPYIIDFDYNVNLNSFYNVYKNCKLILVSSLEAFNYLKLNNCPLSIYHLPLSISDIHKLNYAPVKKKEIDLIVVRHNKVFTEYLEKFASENPEFEYVVRRWEGGKLYRNNIYHSNKRGVLGEFSDRNSYLELLRNSKVALYSTPGFDDNNERFMNHVTPSLFEFISSGCRVIARYPKNYETDFFQLEKISPSIQTYDDFRKLLSSYLTEESEDYLNESSAFLEPIYTSCVVDKLRSVLIEARD